MIAATAVIVLAIIGIGLLVVMRRRDLPPDGPKDRT